MHSGVYRNESAVVKVHARRVDDSSFAVIVEIESHSGDFLDQKAVHDPVF
jgi:hypothetical protein